MAEKEYIEREAVLALLKDDREVCANSKAELKYIRADIRDIPAADVRPVVMCKDCKHRFMKPNGWHCPYAEWGIDDDDFCSCGEKREES